MDPKSHWQAVYQKKRPDALSWFQPTAQTSLKLIQRVVSDLSAPILDVGGGASVLVDDLLRAGYQAVTVLDIAGSALLAAQCRLGPAAAHAHWLEANVLTVSLPEAHVAVWHDRAVFHFLTTPSDRQTYIAQVRRAVKPGGHVIVATFAEDGPPRCSGLDVVRYSADELHDEFGPDFRLLASEREEHHTPDGVTQQFIYCLCRLENRVR
jgi:ubiquinone/menaquinone biosynthesis C-methylase UbiE